MMRTFFTKPGSGIVLLLAAALIISACGRRGNLEPPQGKLLGVDETTGEEIRGPAPKKPNEPFILDPLL